MLTQAQTSVVPEAGQRDGAVTATVPPTHRDRERHSPFELSPGPDEIASVRIVPGPSPSWSDPT